MSSPLVTFPLRAVHVPSPAEVLHALHDDDLLQGRVVDYTDGVDGSSYAVIHVEGLQRLVIVPIEKLHADRE